MKKLDITLSPFFSIPRLCCVAAGVLLLCHPAAAQNDNKARPYMKVDLVSSYLWRGQRNTGPAIQPVLGIKWRGLNAYLWGNAQLTPPAGQEPVKHEIDLFIKYNLTPRFIVGLKDVYVNNRGDGVFSFGPIWHAANGLDILLNYDFKYLTAEWTTTIAGYDGYTHGGHRSYGSYLILSAPFSFAQVDWSASIGIVPYYCSRYDDDSNGFHVNMTAIKASHTFPLNKDGNLSIDVYTQLMLNPSSRKGYFMAGASFFFSGK